jgi:hypothetical protein
MYYVPAINKTCISQVEHHPNNLTILIKCGKTRNKINIDCQIESVAVSDLNLYRLRISSAPLFSDSDIRVENPLENTQTFYDGGARTDLTPQVLEKINAKTCIQNF